MKFDLPSGAWMDLLRPDQMRSKHVRLMTRSLSGLGGDRRVGSQLVDMNDGVAAILVQDWTCTGSDGEILPIPSASLASLEDMDVGDYLALVNHEYVGQMQDKVFALMHERVTPDDYDDPDSPTGPSVGSGPGERAALSAPRKTASTAGTKRRSTAGTQTGGAGRQSK